MQNLLSWIKGKKTYFLSAAGVVWAVTGWMMGYLDEKTASEILWASLTAAALRNGMPTNAPNL
jgi:hypothetical protein